MRFKDIKQFTQKANYKTNVNWADLKAVLDRWTTEYKTARLDMNPEFQRGYVWTEEQKIAYVEFKLRGGEGSDVIYFNCKGWMSNFSGPFVLVDGKQRLSAVLDFLDNKFPVFGDYYYKDFEGRIPSDIWFEFRVNNLTSMKEVLNWYIEMNTGGTVHTDAEINKVRQMIENIKD